MSRVNTFTHVSTFFIFTVFASHVSLLQKIFQNLNDLLKRLEIMKTICIFPIFSLNFQFKFNDNFGILLAHAMGVDCPHLMVINLCFHAVHAGRYSSVRLSFGPFCLRPSRCTPPCGRFELDDI